MRTERDILKRNWKATEMAVQAAELVMAQGLTSKQAAEQLGVKRTRLFSLLARARQIGAMRAQLNPKEFIEPVRSRPLERELLTQLSGFGLTKAVVLELPPQLSCYREYSPRLDSCLHSFLGAVAAEHFQGIIRDGDYIGVGGGRAVASMVQEVAADDATAWQQCRVASLAGGIMWRSHGDGERFPLAADVVALQLIGALSPGGPPDASAISLCLSLPFLAERREFVAPEDLDVAVVGLGNVVHQFHHFMVTSEVATPENAQEIKELLHGAAQSIDNVSGVMDKQSGGYYYPLLEVLNSAYVIRPPDRLPIETTDDSLIEDLSKRVWEINQFANGMRRKAFNKIPIRIGIGGGLHKTFQIKKAIELRLVNHIVIDALTSEALIKLAAAGEFRSEPDSDA